jgi:hypothetical protein
MCVDQRGVVMGNLLDHLVSGDCTAEELGKRHFPDRPTDGESNEISQTDFTEDLKTITAPALVMLGDDDQIVLCADSDRCRQSS